MSALSQGLPSVATGWSHKYQMLFDEYGFSEGLLDSRMGPEAMRRHLDLIIDPASRARIRATLLERSAALKQQSERMWQDVLALVRSRAAGVGPPATD